MLLITTNYGRKEKIQYMYVYVVGSLSYCVLYRCIIWCVSGTCTTKEHSAPATLDKTTSCLVITVTWEHIFHDNIILRDSYLFYSAIIHIRKQIFMIITYW